MKQPKFLAAVSAATFAFALAGAPPASAEEAVVLEPSSPWQLDMAENKCRLVRLYGPEENRHLVFFEQWDPSAYAAWAVAGPAFKKFRDNREAEFLFGSGGDGKEFSFVDRTLGDFGPLIQGSTSVAKLAETEEEEEEASGFRKLDAAGARLVDRLVISQLRKTVTFELGSMEAPLDAMNMCMEDLVKSWGFDPEVQKTITKRPKFENMKEVATLVQRHYPADALRKGAQADFHLRLTIDAQGGIEDCRLLNQTLADDFDMRRHPCTVFKKHAKVAPALDSEGQPVRTYYATRIVYRMG